MWGSLGRGHDNAGAAGLTVLLLFVLSYETPQQQQGGALQMFGHMTAAADLVSRFPRMPLCGSLNTCLTLFSRPDGGCGVRRLFCQLLPQRCQHVSWRDAAEQETRQTSCRGNKTNMWSLSRFLFHI